jgi:hypothetical protein
MGVVTDWDGKAFKKTTPDRMGAATLSGWVL